MREEFDNSDTGSDDVELPDELIQSMQGSSMLVNAVKGIASLLTMSGWVAITEDRLQ